MSTRSRANPWFRPVVPIAKAIVEGVLLDAKLETRMRPIIVENGEAIEDERYAAVARSRVRAMVVSRLSTKLVLTARLFDPEFDVEVREICPELAPLDPVTTAELRRVPAVPELTYAYSGLEWNDHFGPAARVKLARERAEGRAARKYARRARYMRRHHQGMHSATD